MGMLIEVSCTCTFQSIELFSGFSPTFRSDPLLEIPNCYSLIFNLPGRSRLRLSLFTESGPWKNSYFLLNLAFLSLFSSARGGWLGFCTLTEQYLFRSPEVTFLWVGVSIGVWGVRSQQSPVSSSGIIERDLFEGVRSSEQPKETISGGGAGYRFV